MAYCPDNLCFEENGLLKSHTISELICVFMSNSTVSVKLGVPEFSVYICRIVMSYWFLVPSFRKKFFIFLLVGYILKVILLDIIISKPT